MKRHSNKNTWGCSNGDRLKSSQIATRVTAAKKLKMTISTDFRSELSGHEGPCDCSHIISVKYCKETGRSELAWSQGNLRYLTRPEHERHDALTNIEREAIYKVWNEKK